MCKAAPSRTTTPREFLNRSTSSIPVVAYGCCGSSAPKRVSPHYMPPIATCARHLAIQSHVRDIHEEFASDSCVAADAARIMRIPGTINTRWSKYVSFFVLEDYIDDAFRYTLEEMEVAFKADGILATQIRSNQARVEQSRPNQKKQYVDLRTHEAKRKGYRSLYRQRLAQLYLLANLRGGFRKGHRNNALVLLSHCLKGARHSRSRINTIVHAQARRCHPPFPKAQTIKAIASGTDKLRMFRNETMSHWLKITAEEARCLSHKFGPAALRAMGARSARDHQVSNFVAFRRQPSRLRLSRVEARQKKLVSIIQESRSTPTPSEMLPILRSAGFTVTLRTVQRDYRKLSLGDTVLAADDPDNSQMRDTQVSSNGRFDREHEYEEQLVDRDFWEESEMNRLETLLAEDAGDDEVFAF